MSFKREMNGFNRMPSHTQSSLTVYLPKAPVIVRANGVAWMSAAKMLSSKADWECLFVVLCYFSNLFRTDFETNFSEFPY